MERKNKHEYASLGDFPIPESYHVENVVLGMLISSPQFIYEARNKLSAESFSDPKNAELWNILCEMDDNGKEIALETILTRVDTGHFQNFILPKVSLDASFTEISECINSLWFMTMKRKAYFAAMNMLRSSCSDASPDDSYNIAVDFINDIEKDLQDNTTVSLTDAINNFSEVLKKRENDRKMGIATRIPTSFPTLDFNTYGGFARGNLVIIAARPSVGKTALSLFMARKSSRSGFPTAFFSLEMTNDELAQRTITATGKLSGWEMAKGDIDWRNFEEAVRQIENENLFFNDKSYTLSDICSKISILHRKGKCEIAFIDYLGLIQFPSDNRSIYMQVTETTKKLKRLAKELNIPIVLLCQLNRDMSKEGREPQLHDLRDSGSIEQDADIVLMLDRKIAEGADGRVLRMFVRKNRQGPAGMCINLQLDDTYNNYYELREGSEMGLGVFEKEEDDDVEDMPF